jgi:hypothetical protein
MVESVFNHEGGPSVSYVQPFDVYIEEKRMSTPKPADKPVLHNTEEFPLSEWERHWKETQRIENELGKNEPEKDAPGSDESETPAPKKKAPAKKKAAEKP